MSARPLCVSLVGGLLPNSPVAEAALTMLKRHPASVAGLPLWLVRGRATLAREVAQRVSPAGPAPPWREAALTAMRDARSEGRPVVLVSTAPEAFTTPFAESLEVDEVLVVDSSTRVAALLRDRFGEGGFDFVGSPSERRAVGPLASTFVAARGPSVPLARVLRRTLRVHQWLKNLLIFLPVLGAQRFTDATAVTSAFLAFVAFSLVASSVYIVNDSLDLRDDRRHPTKRSRPFASGALTLARAPLLVGGLLLVSAAITFLLLPPAFRLALGVYLLLTFAYSLKLKGAVLVDVVTLAGLYTLRILAGAAATGIQPSVWLLGFSLFFFLSLALVKRYAELHERASAADHEPGEGLPGRGYQPRDLPVLIALGVGTGCVAVLVLALYVISEEFAQHYRYPVLLWQLAPLMLYWIGRAWIVVARDEMHDDPVVWAVRDQISRWVALAALVILLLAR
jgi:4-hydroxybenzoate polyprenyltransferase